ncbi:MAG: hypothetical protein ACREKN_06910 [Longimicrobiaceae bacterium]
MPFLDNGLLYYLQKSFARDRQEYRDRPPQVSEKLWHDTREPEHAVRWHERGIFFAKVQEVAPPVVKFLREQVLPALERTDSKLRRPDAPSPEKLGFLLPEHWPDEPRSLLEEWARRFSLTDPWAIEVGTMTVCRWLTGEHLERDRFYFDWMEWRGSDALRYQQMLSRQHDFEFILPGWDMCVDRAVYEKDMMEMCKKWLQQYCTFCELCIASETRAKTPQKRARTPKLSDSHNDGSLHFEWLARFQVLGDSHKKIAQDHKVADKTVAAGCQNAAARIGLTRRSQA